MTMVRERAKAHGFGRIADGAVVATALGLAWVLKSFYSRASFESLLWVLAPTAKLVEWMTGATFAAESNGGYVSRDRLYAIAPACAGVNFMIAAFCSLCCGLAHTRSGVRERIELVAASAAAAYAATVVANATRISIAIALHDAQLSAEPFTADRLHLAVGVTVYFLFLCAVFAAGVRATEARRAHAL